MIDDQRDDAEAAGEAARRRRLAEVFGEVLPETTTDEYRPHDRNTEDGAPDRDSWYRENRPPHHGG